VFTRELQRHRESHCRICWGSQGHLAKFQNLMPDYRAVLARDEATAMDLVGYKYSIMSLRTTLANTASALSQK